MTRVEYSPAARRLRLTGHAGAGERGSDPVCAALSILVYALLDAGAGTGAAPVEGAMGCIGLARGVSTVKCSTNHACCAQKAENDGAAAVSACVNPSHARVASATASVGAWYTRSRRAPSQPICGATNATVLRRARRTARSCCVSTTSSTSPRRSVRTTCCVPADHTSASERNYQQILATSAQQR